MARDRSPNKRLWKVRIYPSADQTRAFERILAMCCSLYNAALQERRDAYRISKTKIDLSQQCRELTEVRREFHDVRAIYQEVEANVLRRVHLAFMAFFARCKRGATPGYPRFKKRHRYHSFEYPHGDRAVTHDRDARTISLPGIGSMRYRDERGVPPTWTVVTIVRKNARWYACFETVIEPAVLAPTGVEIGVDVGVANLAVTSDGVLFENPRHGRRYRRIIERHQRRVAASTRGSKRRRKRIRVLARAKEREANARLDSAHKASRELANHADTIVFENLKIPNMTRSAAGTIETPGTNVRAKAGLNREILDAAWRRLITFTSYKAAEAGRLVAFVDARNTSRTCSSCGHVAKENRTSQASFACVACGHAEHADRNAAKNILARYHARLGLARAA